jgi:hypothetical protein
MDSRATIENPCKRCFLCRPCRGYIKTSKQINIVFRVEAGSNTSTVALRVVGGAEKGTLCLGYNRATMFLGDINMGTWPSMLGEPPIWDSKMWSRVPRELDMRLTALARGSSNCKRQTRPLVGEDVIYELWKQVEKNSWSWVSSGLSPRRSDWRYTARRKVTLTMNIVKDRPVLSSGRAPHINKPATVWQKESDLESQIDVWHQDRLAEWLSVVT